MVATTNTIERGAARAIHVPRYIGRVMTVRKDAEGKSYGYIQIASVNGEDGAAAHLSTADDIFIHQDDCNPRLAPGLEVDFVVAPDRTRGGGTLRAMGAVVVVEAELVPEDDALLRPFTTALARRDDVEQPRALSRPIEHPWASRMKPVDPAIVAQVHENDPMPDRPRDETRAFDPEDPRVASALAAYLEHEFPHLAGLEFGYDVVNADPNDIQAKTSVALAEYRELGMEEHARHVEEEVKRFLGTQRMLAYLCEHRLLRPNTCLPKRYLPELLAACPVWFYPMSSDDAAKTLQHGSRQNGRPMVADPLTHPHTKMICDLFPGNMRWADTFQLFNRRARALAHYEGDVIPTNVARLIREAQQHFDIVTVITPYLALAGADWEDLDWIRSIDPYVLGISKGLSHVFVLARFSDSGVFPGHAELVADAVAFLRANKEKLRSFNTASNPYWYSGRDVHDCSWDRGGRVTQLGNFLVAHTEQMLAAFDAGHLFDWLRKEWDLPRGDEARV